MALTKMQSGVLKRMMFGIATSLAIVILGAWFNPFSIDEPLNSIDRLSVAIKSAMLPALFLAASIGRLAKHRFFTSKDIDGGALSNGTKQAKILQSLLQNTLEQFVLAFIVYLAWAIVMPAAWLSVVPLAAIAFAIGRIMFFAGYKDGAKSRALGFTLSFYPSVVMLACTAGVLVWQQIG